MWVRENEESEEEKLMYVFLLRNMHWVFRRVRVCVRLCKPCCYLLHVMGIVPPSVSVSYISSWSRLCATITTILQLQCNIFFCICISNYYLLVDCCLYRSTKNYTSKQASASATGWRSILSLFHFPSDIILWVYFSFRSARPAQLPINGISY